MSLESLNKRIVEQFDDDAECFQEVQCAICGSEELQVNTDCCLICFMLTGDERIRCGECLSRHHHSASEAKRAADALMGDA